MKQTNAFTATKNMYREFTMYTKPLSYEEWLATADDLKAAILFVQFFDQITLAWHKTKSFYTPEEDGVDVVNQYLMKNVPIIAADKTKFTPAYIYQVAFNCIYCVCHDIKKDKERFEKEVSNTVQTDNGDELDLFDLASTGNQIVAELDQKAFWAAIEDPDVKTEKVIDYLINGGDLSKPIRRTSKNSLDYESDRLRDVAVSTEEMTEIVNKLRARLAEYA